MGIKIDSKGLRRVLEETPPEQNIMLTGKHGIGKSRILENFFEETGKKVITLFLGQMSDPGDLIGLPYKDEKTGKTDFMPPYWWPHDGNALVLFLDELNRARPEVLQTVMDLTLNRRLAGKSLPDGSRIISAVNAGDEYQLTDLDPALVSRFNIYDFNPSVDEWLLWAQENKLDNRVIDFIAHDPEMLDGKALKKEDMGLEKTPDRRAWERVSKIIYGKKKLENYHKIIIAGVVGMPASSSFIAFCADKKMLSAHEVLSINFSNIEKDLSSYSVPDLASLNESLFRYLETNELKDDKKKLAATNLCEYFDLLQKTKKREAMAHFANLYSDGKYKNAIAFVITECTSLLTKITLFIRDI